MILYSVYINDVECPKLVFQTYQEEKAKTFINKYNSINLVDDWDKAFISENEISPETVEEKADKEISEYKEYFGIRIRLYRDDSYDILTTSKHYDSDMIEYCDWYVNDEFDEYREVVIVETDLQKFFDLSDEEIIKRAKAIIEELNNYFN